MTIHKPVVTLGQRSVHIHADAGIVVMVTQSLNLDDVAIAPPLIYCNGASNVSAVDAGDLAVCLTEAARFATEWTVDSGRKDSEALMTGYKGEVGGEEWPKRAPRPSK